MFRNDINMSIPGQTDAVETYEAEIGWGRVGLALITSAQLDTGTVDSGNTPTTMLRRGLLLGRIASSGKLTHYDPDATNGTDVVVAVLLRDVRMTDLDATTLNRFVPILVGGPVNPDKLIVSGGAAGSIDQQARAQMAGKFVFNDANYTVNTFGWRRTIPKTANYSVVSGTDNNTIFTTTGAAGSVTFTLPAPAATIKGQKFRFVNCADQDMAITGTADKLVAIGDLAATSITFSFPAQKIGAVVEVFADETGAKWIATVLSPNPFVVS